MPFAIISVDPVEVLSLADAKRNLDVTFNDDDILIAEQIEAAIGWVQEHTNRVLRPTTLEAYFNALSYPLRLPLAPLKSIVSMSVNAVSYTPRLVGTAILPPAGEAWPYLPPLSQIGSVTVRYTAGYDAGMVPPVIKQAIQFIVAIYYDKPNGKEAEAQWSHVTNMLSILRVRNL